MNMVRRYLQMTAKNDFGDIGDDSANALGTAK